MIRPRLQIEVESALKQFIPFADIAGGTERVLEPDRTVFDFGKRQVEIALAEMGCAFHSNQDPIPAVCNKQYCV